MNIIRVSSAFLMLLASCASPPSGNPSTDDVVRTASRFELPEAAGSDVAKSQLHLLLDIEKIEDVSTDEPLRLRSDSLMAAKQEVEVVLPRMKRFTVFGVFNGAAKRLGDELKDLGEIGGDAAGEAPPVGLNLNMSLTFNCSKKEDLQTGNHYLTYKLTLRYSLADAKGGANNAIRDSREASGSITEVEERFAVTKSDGSYTDAFNPRDAAIQRYLVQGLANRVIRGMCSRLAKALPVTGKVTGFDGSYFSVDVGSANGVYPGPVSVWAQRGDFSYPIAETWAEPNSKRSMLRVIEWNYGNERASQIIKEIKAGGIPVQGCEIFATTKDIPDLEKHIADPSARN